MSNGLFSFDLASAPSDVAELYANSLAQAMRGDNMDAKTADGYAMRCVHAAGWYLTAEGWQQLGPDVRDKVNLRRAEKQPNGTFIVRDVDVFYPNDAKKDGAGVHQVYTAERIAKMIDNTNASISTGAPAPGLSVGHPHPLNHVGGVHLPAVGACMNWRPSPRKAGQAAVDIVGIPADTMDGWLKGKYIGLSAGPLPAEANGGNERFGHVALLGAAPQALSELPQAIVYAEENMLTFAADQTIINEGKPMLAATQTAKTKMLLSAAMATLAASFAAVESGQDKDHVALKQTFASLSGVDFTGQEPQEKTWVPEQPELPLTGGPKAADGTVDVGEKGEGKKEPAKMDATTGTVDYAARISQLESENQQLTTAVRGLIGKSLKTDFAAVMSQAKSDGLVFDADSKMVLFEALVASGNKQGIEALKADILKSPKSAAVAIGTVFGAEGQEPASKGKPANEALIAKELKDANISFDAKDVAMGAAIASGLDGVF